MRKLLLTGMVFLAAGASIVVARGERSSNLRSAAPIQQPSTQQQGASQELGNQQPPAAQIVPPAAVHQGPIIILNPAHGGADTGARGSGGTVEKDVVLLFARIIRVELERQGYRVMMTRNDDSNPSYDDRAAVANSHRDALFISIHLASTGTVGTMRTYYYQFASTLPATGTSAAQQPASSSGGLVPWEEAQRPYAETSHHFADILGGDLTQHFNGSPAASTGVAVRELRSVAAPAVAVEISSVAVSDPNFLTALAQPLATSILRSIQVYRPAAALGAK